MNHIFSVGIIPVMVGMKVMIYDHQNEELKEYEGNMFESIGWINKNVNLKETVAVIQNIDMISAKFVLFKAMKDHIDKMLKYFKWKRKPTRYLPDEKYDFPELQSDFFNVLTSHDQLVTQKTVQKIVTQAFKMRGVLVIGCDGTPVEEKIMEKIRFDSKVPSSLPGGPNDNIFVIKS